MTSCGPWHTEDFDDLSWHDVHVHGIRFAAFNDRDGTADFVLDLDYILKWEQVGNAFQFTVCAAELRFHDIFRLKLDLDYQAPSAGMCPFSIHGINREPLDFPTGVRSFRWNIPINWPSGSLEFEAPAFTLTLTGTPVVQSGQALVPEQRTRAS